MTDQFSCPMCGAGDMQLLGNLHGEQYYRCAKTRCYGSRDVEGSAFSEENKSDTSRRTFVRIDRFGYRNYIYREERGPSTKIEAIPGQPGLFRDPHNTTIINVRDFFPPLQGEKQWRRGYWTGIPYGAPGEARPDDRYSRATQLEELMPMLAAEPQRTVARMFAVVEGRDLPRIDVTTSPEEVNNLAPDTSEPQPEVEAEAPMETQMTDDTPQPKKTTKSRLIDQGKDIGSAMLDGLAEATVEEAGDVLIEMAQELFEGEALLQLFLATPDGRELTKGLMALMIDSVAVHTAIPKGEALRELARYQFRPSARRVGGPRIKKVMKRFSKLIELSERLPELPEGTGNVVDFAEAAVAKASVGR